jgi:competence protein ComEA
MLSLTDQEKKVVLFVCLVIGGGSMMEGLSKLAPARLAGFSIVGNDAFYPKVNVNTASLDELLTIPQIGPSRAAFIFEARKVGGPFRSLEDLERAGLGEGMIRRMGKYLKVK